MSFVSILFADIKFQTSISISSIFIANMKFQTIVSMSSMLVPNVNLQTPLCFHWAQTSNLLSGLGKHGRWHTSDIGYQLSRVTTVPNKANHASTENQKRSNRVRRVGRGGEPKCTPGLISGSVDADRRSGSEQKPSPQCQKSYFVFLLIMISFSFSWGR